MILTIVSYRSLPFVAIVGLVFELACAIELSIHSY